MLSRARWTLSRKLILALLLMVAVPFLAVQTLYYLQRYERDRLDALDSDREIAEAAARAIEAHLSDTARMQQAAGLAVVRMGLGEEEADQYLSEVKSVDDTISQIFMVRPDGIVWAATDPAFVGRSVDDRSYYRDILAGKNWTVSEVLQGKVTTETIVVVSTAIRREGGEIAWIIASSILPASLERVASIKLSGQRQLLMIDQAGMLIEPTSAPILSAEQRRFAGVPALAAALGGTEQLVSVYTSPRDGGQRMGAFTPVPQIGWVVGVTEPIDQALRQPREAAAQSLIILALLTIVAVAIAWALSNHLTRPLAALRGAARALGAGDLSVRAPVSTRDEVGDLAATFNGMAEKVQERTAENERRLRELSVLEEIGGMLVSHAGLQQTLDAVADLVKQLSGGSEVMVWLADAGEAHLEARSVASDAGVTAGSKLGFRLGRRHGAIVQKSLLSELLVIADAETDERISSNLRTAIVESGIRSLILLPLVVRSSLVGLISVGYSTWTELPQADLSKYRILADQVAISVENARLYDRLNHELSMRGDEVRSLHAAVQAVASTLRPSEVQERLVRVACELFHAHTAWLSLYNSQTGLLEVDRYFGVGEDFKRRLVFPPGQGTVGKVFASQKPLFVPDLSQWENAVYAKEALAAGIKSVLCAPLVSKGQILGVLGIATGWMSDPNALNGEHMDALTSLASHAAVAIENAKLYESMTQSNKELVTTARRLEAVVEAMPAGVFIVDKRSGMVTSANKMAIELLGDGIRPAVPYLERLPANARTPGGGEFPVDDLPLVRSLRHGEVCRGVELLWEHQDGRRVTLLANTAPLFDAEGEIVGAVSVFQDIDRLKAADRLKDEFVSLVSHELRTPLTAIKAYATSLLQKDLRWPRQDRDRFLRVMVQECDRLTRMVQSLLDLSAIESGSLRIQRHWCDLRELLEGAVERLDGVLAGHVLRLDFEPNLPAVAVDRTRFQQVVANLVENAAKYSPPGSAISVSCHVVAEEALITVLDQGPGVPEEERDHVFEKFYRGAKASSGGNQGVGLGLAICRGFVNAHGGRIFVSSNDGTGAAFIFTTPLSVAPEEVTEGP